MKNRSTRKTVLTLLSVVVGLAVAFSIVAFATHQSSSASAASYYSKIVSIEDTERLNPARFLSSAGTYRERLLAKKIRIDGEIVNRATVASYKDVTVKVTYYSKTKSVVSSSNHTLYEVFPPSSTKAFRLDVPNYRNVASIGWDVVAALPR